MITFNKEKTTLTDEFLELENDVELRRVGITRSVSRRTIPNPACLSLLTRPSFTLLHNVRLHCAATAYHSYLLKKKTNEAIDDSTKLYPIEAVGLVMISHGDEFGEDSAFGTSLLCA